ncbi:hypothetical protein WJX81_000393 [Elliptochloris bilobata]|uniref:Probable glutamyl endopeptidase, chloroplastic n=1 Tax=Elliptochloris bilobata TaxID=381761 RepID=A0AAW1RQ95_9CHLO
MNAPDRYEKFVVPEGVQKISLDKDTKVLNAATFTLQREDHTVGNLLRMQLHRDKEVLFAGYKLPHPLEYRMLVKVQTRGRRTPRDVVDAALMDLVDEFADMKTKFQESAARRHVRHGVRAASSANGPVPSTNGAGPAPAELERPKHGYKTPPQEFLDVVDRPPEPSLSFSPDRRKVLQLYRPPPMPPISELARPEVKLAGVRVDPDLMAQSRMGHYRSLALVDFTPDLVVPAPATLQTPVRGYPEGAWLNLVSWSRDSRHVSFTIRSPGGVGDPPRQPLELWVADAATGAAHCLLRSPELGLNAIFDDYEWVDDDTIAALVVPADRGLPPQQPPAPIGPNIQDNTAGRTSQARTYPDLLANPHDEALFEYYTTSELVLVSVSSGEAARVGPPRLYTSFAPSPDGRFLLVAWLERPFSYTVPCGRFPKRIQLWDREGNVLRELAALPLAEDIPIAHNSCRRGPRSVGWRDDRPANLEWIEAQDGGDPAVAANPRDIVFALPADEAASGAQPRVMAQTELRCGGVAWGDGDLALLYESWYKTRRSRVWAFAPDDPGCAPRLVWDRDYEDAYSDPGSPIARRTALGTYVLAQVEGSGELLLQGWGASPEGSRPFLDALDIESGATRRLWQSAETCLEQAGSLLSDRPGEPLRLKGLQLLMSRQSVEDQPQTHVLTLRGGDAPAADRQLTQFPHPYPTLRGLQKEIVRYQREDGLDLNATLYLPPGYDRDRDGRLPCLLWAYPREYKSREAAGQLRRSPHEFAGIEAMSPLLWLARGYAVLDGPGFPIVAEGGDDAEPNDTYVQQLTAAARAAVQELDRRGVVDTARIAVGGHSYGAFMAANLLAHAGGLFACGIARSGAYNRTLTPFGFQAEERTLWQAPQTYITMSPFMQADKIKQPLLLVHGQDDNNTGTYPLQSERFYAALKGHGAPARLVLLPHESHGYRARESVLHVLAEQDQWLRRYCEGQAASDSDAEPSAEEEDVLQQTVAGGAAV